MHDVGLHKAFYLESQRQIAQMHSLAPFAQSRRGRGGWRQRLSQAVHFPSRDEVYRFMDDVVRPAIADVREVFEQKGLVLITQDDLSHDNVSLKVGHGEEQPSSTRCRCAAISRRRLRWVGWVLRS